ncbi:uncharacterized protein LOC135923409 isoform X2 [Gordionus sp. m RMFG-2023]|uniref:uncharacterized protein LOC135923409 isoform X2 n=1 Tax=Gordionus sp. m RMFG-2023 TaxID=3053472 RepID=UPI0031FDD99F
MGQFINKPNTNNRALKYVSENKKNTLKQSLQYKGDNKNEKLNIDIKLFKINSSPLSEKSDQISIIPFDNTKSRPLPVYKKSKMLELGYAEPKNISNGKLSLKQAIHILNIFSEYNKLKKIQKI